MPAAPEPIFCYVTDRRSLDAGSAPPGPSDSSEGENANLRSLRDAIRNAAAAGAHWIQIREKDLEGQPLIDLARYAVAETIETGAKVFVNDRLDVAIASGAAGVHLAESSLPLETFAGWRASAGRAEFLAGVSCHSLESARFAEQNGANYIFFGPVFNTPSKAQFGRPQGLGRLGEICAAVKIPVLAIGGVNLENARACLDAGASGVAAIRLFQQAARAEELRARLQRI